MARINQSGLSEVRLQQKQRPKQYRRSKVLVLFSQACPASQDASLRHRVAGYEIFGSRQSQLPMTTVQACRRTGSDEGWRSGQAYPGEGVPQEGFHFLVERVDMPCTSPSRRGSPAAVAVALGQPVRLLLAEAAPQRSYAEFNARQAKPVRAGGLTLCHVRPQPGG